MSKIRVLLTDDHTLFRQGIHTLLAEETDIDVVGEAANGTEAVEKVGPMRRALKPRARSRSFVPRRRFFS